MVWSLAVRFVVPQESCSTFFRFYNKNATKREHTHYKLSERERCDFITPNLSMTSFNPSVGDAFEFRGVS